MLSAFKSSELESPPFFPMIVASFRWGFASGMRVTLASAALLVTVGLLAAPPPPEFELQRFLIRPVFQVAFGYVIASRAGPRKSGHTHQRMTLTPLLAQFCSFVLMALVFCATPR